MDLSFLVAATQPTQCLYKVLESIENAVRSYSKKYTYEILVSSFSPVNYRNAVWIEDQVKKSGNSVQAYNRMAKESKGEYLFILNNDAMFPNSNPLNVVDYLNSDVFAKRKYKISGIGAGPNTNGWLHRMTGTAVPNGTLWHTNPERFPDHAVFPQELKSYRYCWPDYRYLIVGYPVFHRETVKKLGGNILNPSFKHHFADNWLPFFIGETDGYLPVCEDTALEWCAHPGENTTTVNDKDDYYVYCHLATKLLKEGCEYSEIVKPIPLAPPPPPKVMTHAVPPPPNISATVI